MRRDAAQNTATTTATAPKPRAAAAPAAKEVISPRLFYGEYHGHLISHLEVAHAALRGRDGRRPIIWLAGDSSLDNKHWLLGRPYVRAVGGMTAVLEPPKSVPDVAHQLASECARRGLPHGVLNCAVEESTLGERCGGRRLLPQDEFLRDHLRADDLVIVSVGGNDVALRPTLATILAMAGLAFCSSRAAVASGWAAGSGHFQRMYRVDGAGYLRALVSRCAPAPPADAAEDAEAAAGSFSADAAAEVSAVAAASSSAATAKAADSRTAEIVAAAAAATEAEKAPASPPAAPASPVSPAPPAPVAVALCTIYFPDANPASQSWAGGVLWLLGYDSNPGHLQARVHGGAIGAP